MICARTIQLNQIAAYYELLRCPEIFGASAPKRAIKNTIQMDGVFYCHSCPKKNRSKNLIFYCTASKLAKNCLFSIT